AQVGPAGASGRDNQSGWDERLAVQPEVVEKRIEAAPLRAMRNRHSLDVEGRGRKPLAHGDDLRRRDEKELGRRVDEAADQPGAGDAVDLGPLAGDPEVRGGQG